MSKVRSAMMRFSLLFFFAELFELSRFARQHAAVHFLPAVERLLRDACLAADVADRDAAFDLLQDRGDLLN